MLEIVDVSKIYKSRRGEVAALDNISICFGEKGMVFIVGPSGAGKSTLFNLIALHDAPTSGEIRIDGISTKGLSQKKSSELRNEYFSFMRQDGDLIDRLNVYENLALATRIQGRELSKEEATSSLISLGLTEDILNEYPDNLSGGQKQRVSFARGILKGCKVILADEPTSSLDGPNAGNVLSMLKEASKDRLVIVICHDRSLAELYGDRIIGIKDGKIISDSYPILEGSGEPKPFQARKVHLPFKDQLSFAFSSFSGLVGRSILTCLSLSIALVAFMGGTALAIADANPDFTSSMLSSEASLGRVRKSIRVSEHLSNSIPFSEEEAEEIQGEYDGNCLFFSEYGLSKLRNEKGIEITEEYTVLSSGDLDLYNLELVGELPVGNEQIAVTAYSAYLYEWIDSPYPSKEDLQMVLSTGKILTCQGGTSDEEIQYEVTGFIITNFPEEPTKGEIEEETYRAALECEMHRSAFLSESGFSVAFSRGGSDGYQSYVYPLSEGNLERSQELLSSLYSGIDGLELTDVNRLTPALASLKSLISGGRNVFLAAMGLFFIIYILCFASFLSAVIERDGKNVMTLKSLGVDDFRIRSIFAIEGLAIVLVSLFIAYLLFVLFCYGIDYYLFSVGYPLGPSLLTFLPFLLAFVLSIAFCFLLAHLLSLVILKRKRIF